MAALVTISLSMHVRCASCQSSIHLGAIVDRARCPSCGRVEPLPPERWRELLDAAVHDGPNLPNEEAELVIDKDEAWVIVHRASPTCAGCGQRLPPNAAQNGRANGKCFCVACGAKISVRAVPPAFAAALPGITHLLEEDGTQLKSPDAAIPDPSSVISVRCPDCGGNIQPDGRSRAVRCPYCSVVVVLPQAVWQRLHTGKNDPHVFYLIHDPAVPRPLVRSDVAWSSLDAITCDGHGNLYGLGTEDGFGMRDAYMLFALDSQLKTKWVRKSLPIDDDGGLAFRNDGLLFAWSKRRYSAVVFRAADGQEVGKVGGQQPSDADRHMLDLSHAESLAIDTDGTFLFSKRDRLVRCAPDGSGTFTWPPGQGFLAGLRAEKLKPFTDSDEEDAEWLENAGDRPTKLHDVHIRVGWDGKTYLHRSDQLACYDRTGKKLWSTRLPKSTEGEFGVDARGIVYMLGFLESETYGIHRVLPNGASLLVDGRLPHTPLRDDRRMTVHPDGTTVVASYGRSLRVFAPDGRMLHRSAQAIERDEEFLRKQAQERGRDRVR